MRSSFPILQPVYSTAIVLTSVLCAYYAAFGYDTLWHIPTGEYILDRGIIPSADVFSATKLGTPWVAHEWLSEVVLAACYRVLGWPGVLLLTAACFALAFVLIAYFLEARAQLARGLILFLLAVALTMITIKTRPQAIAAPVLVLWAISLVNAVERQQPPSFYLLPLMTLWANLHGSFVIGFALALLLGAEAVADAQDNRSRLSTGGKWGFFLTLTVFASLLTPNGIDGLLFPFEVQRLSVAMAHIQEWQPHQVKSLADPVMLWILVMLVFGASGKLRLRWLRLIGILTLLFLALRHVRHVYLLGLLTPVLLATPFCGPTSAAPRLSASARINGKRFARVFTPGPPFLALLVVAGLMAGAALRDKSLCPGEAITAQGAIDFAKDSRLDGPVLNDYQFGATLIFNGIAPFIDGRADMYGDAYLDNFVKAVSLTEKDSPTLLFELIDAYRIEWTLFPPTAAVVSVLRLSDDWEQVYEGDDAVIFIRLPSTSETQPRSVDSR